MKNNITLILLAAAVLLVLFFVSSGKKPPFVPADDIHAVITTEAPCAGCHGPGQISPLKPNHPPKEQCLVCHKRQKKTA